MTEGEVLARGRVIRRSAMLAASTTRCFSRYSVSDGATQPGFQSMTEVNDRQSGLGRERHSKRAPSRPDQTSDDDAASDRRPAAGTTNITIVQP